MAHIRGIPGKDFGFDEKQNLLVIPQNATSTLLIIAASGLEPVIGDDSIVEIVSGNMLKPVEKSYLSGWELAQDVRPITFRGKKQGETTFVARRMDDGRNWIAPMKIIVTDDPHYRQANGRVQVSKELTDRCRQCSTLHEAAIEIALDQLHSDLRAQDKWNTASAAYGAPGENWCGAFAFWCWSEAARLRNVENPFGKQVDVLKSPQKGICWACANSGVARLVMITRTGDAHVLGFTKPPATIENDEPSVVSPVIPGDIMFERHPTAGTHFTTWKHVGMVTTRIESPTSLFSTVEGNSGWKETINQYEHDLKATATVGTETVPRYGFLCIRNP